MVNAGRIADAEAYTVGRPGTARECLEALVAVPVELRAKAQRAARNIEAANPTLGNSASSALGDLITVATEFGLTEVTFADLGNTENASAHLAGSASLPVPQLERLGTVLRIDRATLLAEHLIPRATRAKDAALCGSLCRELLGLKTHRDGRTKAVCLSLSAHVSEGCCSDVDIGGENLGLLELSARAAALFEHAVCTCDDALILEALGVLTAARVRAAAARDGREALEAALPARFVPLIAARLRVLDGLTEQEPRVVRRGRDTTVNLIKLVQAARGHGAHSAQLLDLLGQAGARQCALAGAAWNLTDTHNITVDRVVASVAADILRAARSDPLALLLAVRCAVVSAAGPAHAVVHAQGLVAATLAAAQVWGDEELAEAMEGLAVNLFWAAHGLPEFVRPEDLPAVAGAVLAAGGLDLLSEYLSDHSVLTRVDAAACAAAVLPVVLAHRPLARAPGVDVAAMPLPPLVTTLLPLAPLPLPVLLRASLAAMAVDHPNREAVLAELHRVAPEEGHGDIPGDGQVGLGAGGHEGQVGLRVGLGVGGEGRKGCAPPGPPGLQDVVRPGPDPPRVGKGKGRGPGKGKSASNQQPRYVFFN